jgi:hypothetical protein
VKLEHIDRIICVHVCEYQPQFFSKYAYPKTKVQLVIRILRDGETLSLYHSSVGAASAYIAHTLAVFYYQVLLVNEMLLN